MGLCASKPKPEEPTYYNPFDPNAQHLYRQTVYVDPADGKPKRSKTIKQDPFKSVLPKHSSSYAPAAIIPQPPAPSPEPITPKPLLPAPAAIDVYKPLNRNPLPAPPRDIYAEKGLGAAPRTHERHDSAGKYDTLSSKYDTFSRAGDPLAGYEPPQLHQRKASDLGHRGPLARIENGRIIIDDTPESTPGRGLGPVLPPVGPGPIPYSPPDVQAPLPSSGAWGMPGYQRLPNPDAPWPPKTVSHLVTPGAIAEDAPPAASAQAPVLIDHRASVSSKRKKRTGLSSLFHSFVTSPEDSSDEEEEKQRAAVEKARKKEELERTESLKERQALLDREREKEKEREKRASMKERVKEKDPVAPTQPSAPHRRGSGGPSVYHFEIEDHPGFSLVSPHTVHYEGKLYPTAAHLLEAHKFLQNSDHPEAAEIIRMNDNLPGMYAVGREFEASRRPDWDHIFFTKLDDTMYTKMVQHSAIREQLLSTGDASIVFVAEEPFWGDGAGKRMGHNELGKCLVRVRDRIRKGRR